MDKQSNLNSSRSEKIDPYKLKYSFTKSSGPSSLDIENSESENIL